jgi:hypothetical protein
LPLAFSLVAAAKRGKGSGKAKTYFLAEAGFAGRHQIPVQQTPTIFLSSAVNRGDAHKNPLGKENPIFFAKMIHFLHMAEKQCIQMKTLINYDGVGKIVPVLALLKRRNRRSEKNFIGLFIGDVHQSARFKDEGGGGTKGHRGRDLGSGK